MKKFGRAANSLMYYFAAILFLIAGLVDGNLIYAPIGVCFLILGFSAGRRQRHK